MTALSDAELKVAVAKKLGWKNVDGFGGFSAWRSPDGYEYDDLPDFPNSLDACAPVKQWLREHKLNTNIISWCDGLGTCYIFNGEKHYPGVTASSESRALCLAFLEVEG